MMLFLLSGSPEDSTAKVRELHPHGHPFGVSLAAADRSVIVGAADEDACGTATVFDVDTGSVVAKLDETVWPSDFCSRGTFGRSVAAGGGRFAVGAPTARVAYVFSSTGLLERIVRPDVVPGYESEVEWFGASVAIDARRLVVGGARNGVHVFDAVTGQLLWRRGDTAGGIGGFGAPVAIAGDLVVVGIPTVGAVVAFDGATGIEVWSFALVPKVPWLLTRLGTAIAGDSKGIIVSGWRSRRGRSVAFLLDSRTGSKKQAYRAPRVGPRLESFGGAVALGPKLVLIGDPGIRRFRGRAYVFSRATGKKLRTLRIRGDRAMTGHSVAVAGSDVIVGSPGISRVQIFPRDRTHRPRTERTTQAPSHRAGPAPTDLRPPLRPRSAGA